MTTPHTDADPHTEDHSAPDAAEQLKSAVCCTTEMARDNVWLITAGLFLLGIAVGAAATQAATPDCTIRNASERSLRRLGKRSSRLSHDVGRKISAQIPDDLVPTLTDRLVNVVQQFRFW